jgi:thymidylate synthase (FAD)
MDKALIKVHNDGFVRYEDHSGDDLRVVNAARVSYHKFKESWDSNDDKLIKYLWDNEHTSPFRHAHITFVIRAPIFVLRQWMKHQVGCAWNEQSARYTELRNGFFVPDTWRLQDTKNKQSSAGEILDPQKAFEVLDNVYETINKGYDDLLSLGVCREQARILLPVGAFSECMWTASLHAIMHFLRLRTDSNAQSEIRDYANAIEKICLEHFPKSIELLKNH